MSSPGSARSIPGLLILVSLSSGSSGADAPPAAPARPPEREGGARRSAAIRVQPSTVHVGCVARLSLVLEPPAPPGASHRWSAGDGLLFQDDLPEIEWRAPAREGPCRVSVEVDAGGIPVSAETRIDVRRPSTEGMVWIPPGKFIRGDVRGSGDTREVKTIQNSSDEPCHEVYLDGYWIDRHPVTHEDYARFLEDAVAQGLARVEEIAVFGEHEGGWVPYYYFKPFHLLIPRYYETRNARHAEFLHWIAPDGSRFRVKAGKEKYPIVDVSWFGAVAYARFHGKSLPTEAQWEKAARGTDGRPFPWGRNLPTSYHANLNAAYGDMSPVGTFSPAGDSPYGVADMVSSCVEWTNDWFNPTYYADYRGEMPLRNPTGPFWGRSHAIRGSPSSLQYPIIDDVEAVGFRYSWRFEFLTGDIFANRNTTFRTVVAAGP